MFHPFVCEVYMVLANVKHINNLIMKTMINCIMLTNDLFSSMSLKLVLKFNIATNIF